MRVLFYTGGATGSGHIVHGASLAAAFRRSAIDAEFRGLSVASEFLGISGRLGVKFDFIPLEESATLSPETYASSALYRAIEVAAPDVLVVDLYWFPLGSFIRDLPCKKVILFRQIEPRFFRIRLPDRELAFRPEDYDLVIKTEPHFALPFPAAEANPVVIRNRDEVMDGDAARADLGLGPDEKSCLFAFNGKEGEGAEAWKSWSYLEDEGWNVVRSDNRAGGLLPAVDWFNAFDMLVCGAGYNAFWEARYFRKDAYFVPYPRKFEDQARRAALCSDYEFDENGADQIVRLIAGL